MINHINRSKNWFDQGGEAYARFRPDYPSELACYLASIAPATQQAVDVGCGNGQLTRSLGDHFSAVLGIDPSEDQLAHATPMDNVTYLCGPAEHLPLADHTCDLITAAQAAHWFDLPAFYLEARRVAKPNAIIALISYGALSLGNHNKRINERVQWFYKREIGPFWPEERQLVDSGYQTLDFPFEPIETPDMTIELDWNLKELLGYIATWSAVRNAREAGQEAILEDFSRDLTQYWGDPRLSRTVSWAINKRVGRL